MANFEDVIKYIRNSTNKSELQTLEKVCKFRLTSLSDSSKDSISKLSIGSSVRISATIRPKQFQNRIGIVERFLTKNIVLTVPSLRQKIKIDPASVSLVSSTESISPELTSPNTPSAIEEFFA